MLFEAICEQSGEIEKKVWSKVRFPKGFVSQQLSWKASGSPFIFVASRFTIHNKNKSYSLPLPHWIFCSRSNSLQWLLISTMASLPLEYLACSLFCFAMTKARLTLNDTLIWSMLIVLQMLHGNHQSWTKVCNRKNPKKLSLSYLSLAYVNNEQKTTNNKIHTCNECSPVCSKMTDKFPCRWTMQILSTVKK